MKFKLFFLLTILSISTIVFIQSCKKFETTKTEIEIDERLNTEKFFNTNRTNDPVEQKLVAFIKNQNEKLHFLEKTVNIIGFPRWNKTVVYKTEKFNFASSNDSTITYYIPFVRETQNFVNASLVITANNNDTTFSYLQDAQYLSLQNNTNSYTDSAENLAIFFMQMDKNVFGHNKFAIIDSNLFKFNNHRVTKVTLDTAITSNNVIDGGLCYLTTLSWINCYTNTCTFSDYYPQCMNSISFTYCTAGGSDFPPAGLPTGGGAPSGGNGPGGGGSSSGVGGWVPIPIEDEPSSTAQHLEGSEFRASHPNNWDIQTFAQDTLPTWSQYYNNYPKDSTTGCELDPAAVYEMAGGPLYASHLSLPDRYANACALRTSIALTKCGKTIPLIRELQANGTYRDVTRLGVNGKYYFITASDLYWWMIKTFGTPPPSHVVTKAEALDGIFADKLPLEKGIYIMKAKNSTETGFGATGHVSPFDNGNPFPCGHLYGDNSDVGGGISNVSLWKLN